MREYTANRRWDAAMPSHDMMIIFEEESMPDETFPEEEGSDVVPQRTLAALLTAQLGARLADAVSALVGTAYEAHILRIEPREHGGAVILVEFTPQPLETTLKIELGADMVEIPLPPGIAAGPSL
jgi:hypothetical protein